LSTQGARGNISTLPEAYTGRGKRKKRFRFGDAEQAFWAVYAIFTEIDVFFSSVFLHIF
jgi:hypothetical protein